MPRRASHKTPSGHAGPVTGFAARVRRTLSFLNSWQGVLAAMGMAALITIVVALFLPFGKGPQLIRPVGRVPGVDSPEFLRLVSNVLTTPIETGSEPQILNNGDEFLRSLLADVDGAKQSIDFMAYIWEDGKFSDTLLAHLTRKLKAGVQVRIALDGYGSIRAPWAKLADFERAGGRTAIFHTLMPLPWTMTRDHKRNHRRAIVIDGRIAYTGGIAVADSWLGSARNPKQWRDMMFRVDRSMAAHLQAAFAEVWELGTGEILGGTRFYPPAQPHTGTRQLRYIPFVSSPSIDTFGMENLVLLSLGAAKKSIDIVTPYFLPDRSMRLVLCGKARSGVDVRVLLPNAYNDSHWVRFASRSYYDELLSCGVRISEYQPTFIHTKLLVVDGSWSMIGSANMDNRSRKLNDEVVLGISDAPFAGRLENVIWADQARAQQVTLAQWRQRSVFGRVLEWLALASVQQY
ncbi:MAG TPA: phospholipase D-like domain-containing protein [Rhizomicrobium sp.]|nr:phospholipase D-like domain-containing protein [Rhizomicrobium sp.]